MFFKLASQCRLDMKERENRQQSTTTNKKRGGENSVFIRFLSGAFSFL
jgi:hypothetical protein